MSPRNARNRIAPVGSGADTIQRGRNMAGTIEQKLATLGITLHTPPSPVANYVGFVRTGNLLIISGQVCVDPQGKLIAKGKLGAGVTTEQRKSPAPGAGAPPARLRRSRRAAGRAA